jgi:anaerobic magnesium-protoporphyrin IX monomethyl ester cyclase
MLSACLKQQGYQPTLIDLRRLSGWAEFEALIARDQPDLVGISMMSVDYNPALKAAEIIRQCSPATLIVVGGAHPTIMTDELSGHAAIDVIVRGEGEKSLLELVKNWEQGIRPARIIEGERPDLDCLPYADFELFGGLETPLPVIGFEAPFVTTIAGRGCIYNCSFCQPAERLIFGQKVRRRSVAHVIGELCSLREKYQFKSLMIHDDCLTEDRDWVRAFCQAYLREGFEAVWACQSRADLICHNQDLLDEMKNAHLGLVFVGFESGSQRILNLLRKGTRVEQNYESARILKAKGIRIWANYMFGIPSETKAEVDLTVKMIRDIDPEHCSPAFFTPHPGTDLFDSPEVKGHSLIRNHDSYRREANEAKIEGIDYEYLRQAVYLSTGWKPPLKNSGAVADNSYEAKSGRSFLTQAWLLQLKNIWRRLKLKWLDCWYRTK